MHALPRSMQYDGLALTPGVVVYSCRHKQSWHVTYPLKTGLAISLLVTHHLRHALHII